MCKKLIFTFFLLSVLIGCNVKKQSNKKQETIIEEKEYRYVFMLTDDWELGYDEKYVYLTNISSDSQIVFICEKIGSSSKEELLDSFNRARYRWVKYDAESAKEWEEGIPELCIEHSHKTVTEKDEHFQKSLKRFYVFYRDVIGWFNA